MVMLCDDEQTFEEWCEEHDLDPAEEEFYQRADYEHDIAREDN